MIDTHCHLNDPAYKHDYREIIARFPEDGLSCAVCVGYDIASSERAAELSAAFAPVFFAPGIHPHSAADVENGAPDAVFSRLAELLEHEKCVAVGETGLDYHYPDTDKAAQKKVFERHIELLERTGLPAVIHIRDAWKDAIDILRENRNSIKSGVIHCYSGSYESARVFADLGYYIAFGGAATFRNNVSSGDVIAKLPLERILTETDCPYLAPQVIRGKRNEPKYVSEVLKKIAEVRGIAFQEAEAATEKNARDLFGM